MQRKRHLLSKIVGKAATNVVSNSNLEVERGSRPPGHDVIALVEGHVVGVGAPQLVPLALPRRRRRRRRLLLGGLGRAGLGGGAAPRGAPRPSYLLWRHLV